MTTAAPKWIIGTDEAGYGPRLGPLVIVGTCWRIDASVVTADAFAPWKRGFEVDGLGCVRLADSKELYAANDGRGLARLEAALLAALGAGGGRFSRFDEFLDWLAPEDVLGLWSAPWYDREAGGPFPASLSAELADAVRASAALHAFDCGSRLMSSIGRVLEPAVFNAACERTGNKASALSEWAVRLVARQVEHLGPGDVEVYCDKHGGRAYYAALLLHIWPDARLVIEAEGRDESRYTLRVGGRHIRIRFTAKGDRFAPVGLASITAKYVRERLMAQFNRFWASEVDGLKPTAGYWTDAERFLTWVRPTARRLEIAESDLVRAR